MQLKIKRFINSTLNALTNVIKLLFVLIISNHFIACTGYKRKPGFTIMDFTMLSNWQPGQLEKKISLDYLDAIDSGFIIPTHRQVPEGYFDFTFKFNPHNKKGNFYYKIYYQNETYKYPEDQGMGLVNPLCEENFYGSWEDTETGFKKIPENSSGDKEYLVKDYFRIAGNPRSEERYFGKVNDDKAITEDEILVMSQGIYNDKTWYEDVIRKAKDNKISVEEQIRLDAIWVIRENRKKNRLNQRWKRNPRVGQYSFLLVVTLEDDLNRIPTSVKMIGEKWNGHYLNPYWYFLYGPGQELKNTAILISTTKLSVSAHPSTGAGIYINERHLQNNGFSYTDSSFREDCGSSTSLYSQAHFEQYFHFLHSSMSIKNIPVIGKLQDSYFTRKMYDSYLKNYHPDNMVNAGIANSYCPCQDVKSDRNKNQIELQNPPPRKGHYEKVNVGIISRHGFTYGKFTAKIKFPELLNEEQMWNGITNAFWMLNQSNDDWNRLRECRIKGFIPKDQSGENAIRVPFTSYSEIDIEIRKASPVWPHTSYNPPHERPAYYGDDYKDVIVTCTNWDLACQSPLRFTSGTQYSRHNGKEYLLHRWNPWYQAITLKHSAKDDYLFKRDYFYYQIEWKPDTLIWRIGPEKNQLTEICFMNSKVTTIPDNQMLMVVTQEYHPSVWWPESPQMLEYIPFTETPIKGYVLEFEIE
ncbi:MAG: hypothetical protein JNL47_11830 [Bacteroidia bacterium]|nr:hypothetical protein [Bacteroidia bacterium]